MIYCISLSMKPVFRDRLLCKYVCIVMPWEKETFGLGIMFPSPATLITVGP